MFSWARGRVLTPVPTPSPRPFLPRRTLQLPDQPGCPVAVATSRSERAAAGVAVPRGGPPWRARIRTDRSGQLEQGDLVGVLGAEGLDPRRHQLLRAQRLTGVGQ